MFNLKADAQQDLEKMLRPFIKNHYKDMFKDDSLYNIFREEYLAEIRKGFFKEDEEEEIVGGVEGNGSAVKELFC